jgi:hypothetical protein
MSPFFRNDAEAGRHAALYRPFDQAFGPVDSSYARRYGVRAADAAHRCRLAAARGDSKALYLAQKALSAILYVEKRELFEQRAPRKTDPNISSPWPASARSDSVCAPSNFPSRGTKLDGRVKPGHGENGRAA